MTPQQHDHYPTDDHVDDSEGQVSQGGSGFGDGESSVGGADAVPDTPDALPADRD